MGGMLFNLNDIRWWQILVFYSLRALVFSCLVNRLYFGVNTFIWTLLCVQIFTKE